MGGKRRSTGGRGVYALLSKIYTPEGLAHMVNVKKTAKAMSVESGITGIITPLHPGAEKFWREKGHLEIIQRHTGSTAGRCPLLRVH